VSREPPRPPELVSRIAEDARVRLHIEIDPLVDRVVARMGENDHWDELIHAEELAAEEIDRLWDDDELRAAFAKALDEVHEDYLVQAIRVREAIEALHDDGRGAWIARAIAHPLAEWVAWKALESLDLLTEWPAEALCARCGASLAAEPGEGS
jgi:hypothetical protein